MNKPEAPIVYTEHALQRMSIRGITKEMVKAALASPEQTATGYRNRTLAYKSFDDKRIKVIYTVEDDKLVIISVMWE